MKNFVADRIRVVLDRKVQRILFADYRLLHGGNYAAASGELGIGTDAYQHYEYGDTKTIPENIFLAVVGKLREARSRFSQGSQYTFSDPTYREQSLKIYMELFGGWKKACISLGAEDWARKKQGLSRMPLDEQREKTIRETLNSYTFGDDFDLENPESLVKRKVTEREAVSKGFVQLHRSLKNMPDAKEVYRKMAERARSGGIKKYGSEEGFYLTASRKAWRALRKRYGRDAKRIPPLSSSVRTSFKELEELKNFGVFDVLGYMGQNFGRSYTVKNLGRKLSKGSYWVSQRIRKAERKGYVARNSGKSVKMTDRGKRALELLEILKKAGRL